MPSEVVKGETIRDWDKVQENATDITEKLKIPGGWLYRVTFKSSNSVAMVFVPEK